VLEQGVGLVGMVAHAHFGFGIEFNPGTDRVFGLIFGDAYSVLHNFMQLHKVVVGIGVVSETTGLRVEGNFLAQAVRVVHQVTHHAAIVGVMHIAVGHAGIAGTN